MNSGVGESYWRYYSKGISLLTIKKTGGKLNRDIGKQSAFIHVFIPLFSKHLLNTCYLPDAGHIYNIFPLIFLFCDLLE